MKSRNRKVRTIKVSKLEFYQQLLRSNIQLEEYETCAKIRDYIAVLENPDEIYEIDLDDDEDQE